MTAPSVLRPNIGDEYTRRRAQEFEEHRDRIRRQFEFVRKAEFLFRDRAARQPHSVADLVAPNALDKKG